MPLCLPPALLPQLRTAAIDSGAEKLMLFGSRARGTHRPTSDIDLAVFGLDSTHARRLYLALEDLPTLLQFDLVCVDNNTSPALLHNIEIEGVEIYNASKM